MGGGWSAATGGAGGAAGGGGAAAPAGRPHWVQKAPFMVAPQFVQNAIVPLIGYSMPASG